jgi:hypothetical protein
MTTDPEPGVPDRHAVARREHHNRMAAEVRWLPCARSAPTGSATASSPGTPAPAWSPAPARPRPTTATTSASAAAASS